MRGAATTSGDGSGTRPARAGLRISAALFIAAILPFVPAITAGFCEYDDPSVILAVNGYRGLAPENLRWMFTSTHMGHYQPLTWISYAIDSMLWGLNPVGFHVTNLLVHALNTVLVYRLARRLIAAGLDAALSWPVEAGAAVAALLFAIHPLRVESVAWITERRDVLSTCFLLLASLAYLRAFPPRSVRPASGRWYMTSVALLLLSLLCKAWGMTFFVILVVLDWFPLRRLQGSPWRWFSSPSRVVLLQKAPYAFLGLAAAVMAAHAVTSAAFASMTLVRWGIGDRICQAACGLTFYIQKMLWPTRLAVIYEVPRHITPVEARFVAAFCFTFALALAVIALRRRFPALVAAALVYAIVLGPVLGFMQSGPQLVADRYSYVANLAWAMVLGGGAAASRGASPTSRGGRGRAGGIHHARRADVAPDALLARFRSALQARDRRRVGRAGGASVLRAASLRPWPQGGGPGSV